MDWSIKEYIDNNLDLHGKAVYNAPTWVTSVLNGANSEIDIPLNKNENRRFIIVHQISFSRWGGTCNLIDADFPTVTILPFASATATPFICDFIYIKRAAKLKLIINSNSLSFSILYQTVTQEL